MTDDNSQQNKITPTRQARAIAALLTAKDLQSAAKEAGVSEGTLHRWLDDPSFKATLRKAEGEAIDDAVRRLSGTARYAVGVVISIMADKTSPASVRLRAAQTIVDQLVKLKGFADLEDRIAALEEQIGGKV